MSINPQDHNLEEFIPHKRPMLLLDELLEFDLESKTLGVLINVNPKSMFYDPEHQGVPMWIGIEYMAQAIALLAGLGQKLKQNLEPKIGFIIGARKYACAVPYFVNESQLLVTVKELFVDKELAAFTCIICQNNSKAQKQELARAEVNVFQPESVEEFLDEKAKRNLT